MNKINVLLIEVDPFRREGMLTCISRESDFKMVASGNSLIEALKENLPHSRPDVVIVNLDQVMNMRFWAILRLVFPKVPVIGITEGKSNLVFDVALGVGVAALLHPDIDAIKLCDSIRKTTVGLLDYDPRHIRRMKEVLMHTPETKDVQIGEWTINLRVGSVSRRGKRNQLTPREREVLALLGVGKSNRQIALELQVKESTAAFHVSNVLQKLGVSSRSEAGIIALILPYIQQASAT